MKFNCGPSFAERALIAAQKKEDRLTQWHPFFCLLPRRIGHVCVWLEWVQRKGRQGYCGYSLEWYFEYRLND